MGTISTAPFPVPEIISYFKILLLNSISASLISKSFDLNIDFLFSIFGMMYSK